MLTDVVVITASRTLTLSLGDEGLDAPQPYVIRNITGLGPVPAQITSSPYAESDGEAFQHAKTGKRNIVIEMGYRPDYDANDSVSKLRQDLYSIFPPKSQVTLQFKDDSHKTLQVKGYIESHDPGVFTTEPSVQVSVICPDGYFSGMKDISLTNFNNRIVNPSFIGTAPTGFIFEMFVNRDITGVIIRNDLDTNLEYRGNLAVGDVLRVSTIKGSKGIRITRAITGTVESGLEGLYKGSLKMMVGPNTPAFYAQVTGASDIPYQLTFTPKYLGI